MSSNERDSQSAERSGVNKPVLVPSSFCNIKVCEGELASFVCEVLSCGYFHDDGGIEPWQWVRGNFMSLFVSLSSVTPVFSSSLNFSLLCSEILRQDLRM